MNQNQFQPKYSEEYYEEYEIITQTTFFYDEEEIIQDEETPSANTETDYSITRFSSEPYEQLSDNGIAFPKNKQKKLLSAGMIVKKHRSGFR